MGSPETQVRLGEIALHARLITQEQLDRALAEQESSARDGKHEALGQIMVRLGMIRTAQLCELLQSQEDFELDSSRYEILEELGRGGMAVVYRARDRKLDREVALKVIRREIEADERVLNRMIREARAIAAIDHPNIVKLHDVLDEGMTPCLVMEYVRGRTLREVLKDPSWNLDDRIRLLAQAARALQGAHDQGIVHRDIKPGNIMVEDPPAGTDGGPDAVAGSGESPEPRGRDIGRVVIMDFGLAHLISSEAGASQTITVAGTPQYMAPEQMAAHPDGIDRRTDVYAIGVILYEAILGKPPFGSLESKQSISSLMIDRVAIPPQWVDPSVHPDLNTICMRALEGDPRDRYADAASLATDLECYLGSKPIKARPIGAWTRFKRRLEAHRARFVASSLILVLLAGVFVLTAMLDRKEKALKGAKVRIRTERTETKQVLLEKDKRISEAERELLERERIERETAERRQKAEGPYLRGLNLLQRLEERPGLDREERRKALAEALELFELSVREDPGFVAAWREAGRVHSLGGASERALECLGHALELAPSDGLSFFYRGMHRARRYQAMRSLPVLSLRNGRPHLEPPEEETAEAARLRSEAAEDFRSASRRLADDRAGWEERFGSGLLLLYEGRYREASASLGEAIRLHPSNPESHLLRGISMLYAGDVEGAGKELDRAEHMGLATFEVLVHRGLVAFLSNSPEDLATALNCFDRALKLRPDETRVALYRSFTQPVATLFDLSRDFDPTFPDRFGNLYLQPHRKVWTGHLGDIDSADLEAFNLLVLRDRKKGVPYGAKHVSRVVQFVKGGGGLLVIADFPPASESPGSRASSISAAFGLDVIAGESREPMRVSPTSRTPDLVLDTDAPAAPGHPCITPRLENPVSWKRLLVDPQGATGLAIRKFGKGRVAAARESVLFPPVGNGVREMDVDFIQQVLLWLAGNKGVGTGSRPRLMLPRVGIEIRGLKLRYPPHLEPHARRLARLVCEIEDALVEITSVPSGARTFDDLVLVSSDAVETRLGSIRCLGAYAGGFPEATFDMTGHLGTELARSWILPAGEPLGTEGTAMYLGLEAAKRLGHDLQVLEVRRAWAERAEKIDPVYSTIDISRVSGTDMRDVRIGKLMWIWDRLRERHGEDLLARYFRLRSGDSRPGEDPVYGADDFAALLGEAAGEDLSTWFGRSGIEVSRPDGGKR